MPIDESELETHFIRIDAFATVDIIAQTERGYRARVRDGPGALAEAEFRLPFPDLEIADFRGYLDLAPNATDRSKVEQWISDLQ